MSLLDKRIESDEVEEEKGLFKPTTKGSANDITMDQYVALSKPQQSVKYEVTDKGYKRSTYYIHPVLEEAIACYAFERSLDKSFIVREALNAYMGEEYITKGIRRYNSKND